MTGRDFRFEAMEQLVQHEWYCRLRFAATGDYRGYYGPDGPTAESVKLIECDITAAIEHSITLTVDLEHCRDWNAALAKQADEAKAYKVPQVHRGTPEAK